MAKDYQLECERLRGEIKRLETERDQWKRMWEDRLNKDYDIRDRFKELLIDVLGR